jgi:hypothetical protein
MRRAIFLQSKRKVFNVKLSTISSTEGLVTNPSHNYLIEVLRQIPLKYEDLRGKVALDDETMVTVTKEGAGMFVSQVEMEKNQLAEAMKAYHTMAENLVSQ